MPITTINFNDLPQVVENLFNKVEGIEAMLRQLIERQPEKKETDKHIPLTVEQACEYLQMPKATFYYKVGRGEIPCIKQESGITFIKMNWTSGWSRHVR